MGEESPQTAITQVMDRVEREAQLVALVKAGARLKPAAEACGIPYATAWGIMDRIESDTTIPSHDQAIAIRGGEVQIGMIEWLAEQPPDYQWKQAIALNAMRGTAIDKILKRQEVPTSSIFDTIAKLASEYGSASIEVASAIRVSAHSPDTANQG